MSRLVVLLALFSGAAMGQAARPGSGGVTLSGSTASGRVAYWGSGSTLKGDSALVWDETNNRLGIGVASPAYALDIDNGNLTVENGWSIQALGSGTISANIIQLLDGSDSAAGLISGTNTSKQFRFSSSVVNSGTNTAYLFNTANALSGSTLLLDLQNNSVSKFSITNAGAVTAASTLQASGLSVGVAPAAAALVVYGTAIADGSAFGYIGGLVDSATAFGSSPFAGMQFGGKYTSTLYSGFAGVGGAKENVTSGDVKGQLRFYSNNGTQQTEAARITSGGKLLYGTTTDDSNTGNIMQVGNSVRVGDSWSDTGIGGSTERMVLVKYGAGSTRLGVGQDTTHLALLSWNRNATAGNATAALATFGYTNQLQIDSSSLALQANSAGRVMIGTTTDDGANALQVTGTAVATGAMSAVGFHVTSTTYAGSITLSTGTGTATVVSGRSCVCSDSTAVAAVQCSVSSTTLTATGTGSDVIKYICF